MEWKEPSMRSSIAISFFIALLPLWLAGAETGAPPVESLPKVQEPKAADNAQPVVGNLYIKEYRVQGATKLPGSVVEEAVYPYLGPGRTTDDVDHARAALEKAYQDKGYRTVSVSIPPQSVKSGVILLQVEEGKVGKLLVRGARWYLPSTIARKAKSLQPGTVPNFDDVQKDIVALNKSADLSVKPDMQAGDEPGTYDFVLDVKDKFPLHGSLELNNRYSANTVPLRLNGGASYSNLWQLGHSMGFNFQIAPERTKDAAVYSAFYTFPVFDNTTLTFSGTKQDSDVSTLGGGDSIGRGWFMGVHATVTLPADTDFYHSLSFGIDYKHFDEIFGTNTPIDYYPFSLAYSAGWNTKKSFTELNASLNTHFRGMGSKTETFDNKRYNADGSWLYLRGDLTHTHDLPGGFQVLAKVQGQLSNHPLINNEQLSLGGTSSVRGYLESTALGDDGIVGTLELRSPSFIGKMEKDTREWKTEWRVYAFIDAGRLTLQNTLPQQVNRFDLASYGFGTRIKLYEHFNGSLDASLPLVTQGTTQIDDVFVSFRVWAEF